METVTATSDGCVMIPRKITRAKPNGRKTVGWKVMKRCVCHVSGFVRRCVKRIAGGNVINTVVGRNVIIGAGMSAIGCVDSVMV